VAKAKSRAGEEWVGGIVPLPITIEDAGGAFEPDCLVWLDSSGRILGTRLQRPDKILADVKACLVATVRAPAVGSPRKPSKLRVNNPKLAQVLSAEFPELAVEIGETPELVEFLETVLAGLAQEGGGGGVADTTDVVAEFYAAAADLFEAAPWKLFPSDYPLLVQAPDLDLFDAVLVVIGQDKDVLGWVLLPDLDDFAEFTKISETAARGLKPRIPPHTMVNFQRRAEHPPALVRESRRRGWRIAGRHAYPMLVVASEGGEPTALIDAQYRTAEALCLALCAVSAAQASTDTPWSAGAPLNVRIELPTSAGALEVRLSSVYDEPLGGSTESDLRSAGQARLIDAMRSNTGPSDHPQNLSLRSQRSKNQQKAARRARRHKRER